MILKSVFGIKDDALGAGAYATQANGLFGGGAFGQQQAMMNNDIMQREMRMAKTTHIEIEEASNGLIVRLGMVTRICADPKDLAETIAAVYAERAMT